MNNVDSFDLVSVYVITHNRLSLLKRCLESVFSQNYPNIEIVVVNDCSDDGTSEYLDSLLSIKRNLKVVHNEINKGACYSRNVAIDLAEGLFITGVDDDDYFLENRISDFIESKNLLNEYCCLYTDSLWKTVNGFNKAKINRFFPKRVKLDDMFYFNFIGNQIFCKTELLKKVRFDESMPAWQDLDTWVRLIKLSNLEAYKIKRYNYVQDISHPHERISNSKIDKILIAYNKILIKNNLSKSSALALKNQLISYGLVDVNIIKSFFIFLMHLRVPGILIFIRNFKYFVKFKFFKV